MAPKPGDIGQVRRGAASAPGRLPGPGGRQVGIQSRPAVPQTSYKAMGRMLAAVSRGVNIIEDKAAREEARETQLEAERAATRDVLKADDVADIAMPRGTSIAEEAYRRTAQSVAQIKVQRDAYEEVKRLGEEYRVDPEGFRAALEGAVRGRIGELPEDLRADAFATWDRLGRAQLEDIETEHRAMEVDKARAQFVGAMGDIETELARTAYDGDWMASEPVLDRAANLLSAMGPVEEGGAGVFTRAEVARAMESLEATARDNFFAGWVENAPNPREALEALETGKTGDETATRLLKEMRPDQIESMRTRLEARFAEVEGEAIAGAMEPLQVGGAVDLLREFEGFHESAYHDVNAHRVGYGSDTVTLKDGTVVPVDENTTVSRAQAERDLQRRVAEFRASARKTIGAGAWSALPRQAREALVSVAYNYGEAGFAELNGVIQAARTGDTLRLAEEVEALGRHNDGVNAKRRASEAHIIRRSDPVALMNARLLEIDDPALRRKTEQQARYRYSLSEREFQRQASARESERLQRVAELDIALGRNEVGYDAVEDALARGDIGPGEYAQRITRLDAMVADAAEEATELRAAAAKLEGGSWNSFAKPDRDAVDLLWQNSAQTEEATAALVSATGIAPKPVIADLQQRLRAGDAEAFEQAHAYMLANDDVFEGRDGGADVRNFVEEYRGLTSLGYGSEAAIQRVLRTPEEKKRYAVVDDEAAREWRDITEDLAVAEFNSWLPFDAPNVTETQRQAVLGDMRRHYVWARRDGLAEEEAKQTARQRLRRTWGVSAVAGKDRLMRHPPERYYPEGVDGWEYIAADVNTTVRELGGQPGEWELVADSVTGGDIRAGKLPRYRLFYTDEDGFRQQAPGYFRADADPNALSEARREEFERRRANRTNTPGFMGMLRPDIDQPGSAAEYRERFNERIPGLSIQETPREIIPSPGAKR